jgi:hypothetical protein
MNARLAVYEADQGSILGLAPMEVFLVKQTSNEKNQETSNCVRKCQNAGTLSPASAFLLVVAVSSGIVFSASGSFRYGTAGHGLESGIALTIW